MARIYFHREGIEEIIKDNTRIQAMEQDIMMKKLDEVKARFLQDFGFEGSFKVESRVTRPSQKWGGRRTAFKIEPTNAKTGAALKRRPGWLAQFV